MINILGTLSFLRPYQAKKFWEKSQKFLADPWQHQIFPQHHWLLKQIVDTKPQSILEVGCGFGRNLNYLFHYFPAKFVGVDISGFLLKQAALSPRVSLVEGDAQNLPFADNSFVLVFTHGTLMHMPQAAANQTVSEMIRVSRKWLVIIEETRHRPQKINYFTFAHDYQAIINNHNLQIVKFKKDRRNLIWYLCRKPI